MHWTPYSLNELNITSITSQAMQLDVQGKTSNRFALSWLYSFSMPWCPIGMTIEEWYCSFIPFEDAWRELRPCRVQPRANSGAKDMRIAFEHPPHALTSETHHSFTVVGRSFSATLPELRSTCGGGLQALDLP